ncbi:MAG: exodeoxyribonuclease VII large subunit [Planctomycetes bacterium]|nr:exodeoxyribonuclease VII large subunit [Planctomycetota bacterium]
MVAGFAGTIMSMAKGKAKIYSVTQVNSLVKMVLENNLPSKFVVSGEISSFKKHSSGHCYFSLKDEGSVLPAVMWAGKFKKVKFTPEDGMAVIAKGFIDVYEPQGKYQFYVDKLEPAGVGALQLAFEQMKEKLKKEGLFEDKHKKPIPAYPMRIGILTSETGAAVRDIEDSIFSRWPCTKLFLYPVPVQGKGAAGKIALALRDINHRNRQLKLDLLIVGRGGGSLEDLWAFNEEVLARAIFESAIPIISAVGHEVDTTIADWVADRRASTPTKAGVSAVPDMAEVLEQLGHLQIRMTSSLQSMIELCKENLARILASSVFKRPLLLVHTKVQQVDEMQSRLTSAVSNLLAGAKEKLAKAYEQISRIEPHRLLSKHKVDLNNLTNRLTVRVKAITQKARVQLTAQENRLAAMNPKSVLNRGYSITTDKKTGKVIKTAADIEIGDVITTELAKEILIESQVKKK